MSLRDRIRNSFSETFRTIHSPLTLFIWLAAVALATIAGPFGTYAIMDWPLRAGYWFAVISISVVFGYCARALTSALVGQGRPILFDGSMILLMTLVFTPVVWWITFSVGDRAGTTIQPFPLLAVYVMLCTAVIVVGRRLAPGFEPHRYDFLPETMTDAVVRAGTAAQPRLLRRLAPEIQGDILRLTSKDHFVEVATANGAELLRMRMSDAVDEMEPILGYCVHRSYWVAEAAIVRVERENTHRLFVILSNHDRVPVSRKYRVNLERAGLI